MTVFILKITAMLTMLIDHSAWFMYLSDLIGDGVYTLMRTIGRISFPIFCFLLVNGFEKTSDRRKYLSRLMLFAVISQLPFSVVFCDVNYFAAPGALESSLSFGIEPAVLTLLVLGLCAVWFFFVCRDWSVLSLAALLIMGCIRCRLLGAWILLDHLNVFYTLALGLSVMALLRRISLRADKWYVPLLLSLSLAIVLLFYGERVDYGYSGIALLVLLYLLRSFRPLQALAICLWSVYEYIIYSAVASWPLALCAALAAVFVMFYNGRLGRRVKWGFYIIYPLHLAVFAVLIFVLK